MRSRSNNSSDMDFICKNPTNNSLIVKKIEELKEIKGEHSYEEIEKDDLKQHIIYNLSKHNIKFAT